MNRFTLALTVLLFSTRACFATWSIIMIDPKTKEIGIAGASCTYNCFGIGKIVPDMGAVIVQAMSSSQARNKAVEMILAESNPEQIIRALRDPAFDPEKQQYAIVTIKYIDKPATFTGNSTNYYKGALTASGISVQGNTLTNEDELRNIFNAIQKAKTNLLDISEILMIALEAGSTSGGDKRCGDQRATSAFIIVAKPGSKNPYLNLNIFGQRKGGQNAVVMLRKKFEKWKAS